jgi:hypothetical protein
MNEISQALKILSDSLPIYLSKEKMGSTGSSALRQE